MNKFIGLLLLLAGAIIIFTLWVKSTAGGLKPLPESFDPYKSVNQGEFNEDPHLTTIPESDIYNINFEAPEFPENNGDVIAEFKKMYDDSVKSSLNELDRQKLYYDPSPPPPSPSIQEMTKGETSFTTRTGGGELDQWIGGR